MRVAYVIFAFHKVDQLKRLVARLYSPESTIVLHIDAKVCNKVYNELVAFYSNKKEVFFCKRENSNWASPHQTKAHFNALECLFDSKRSFEYCVALSGADYPLRSNEDIKLFLSKNMGKEFIEIFPLSEVNKSTEKGWSPYWITRRYHVWFMNRHFVVPFLAKPRISVSMGKGSALWALTSNACKYILESYQNNSRPEIPLDFTFMSDEFYIHSLIRNSDFRNNVVGKNLHYTVWKPENGPHPSIFLEKDFDELLASGFLFARKFDMTKDSKIMDMLDKAAMSNSQ